MRPERGDGGGAAAPDGPPVGEAGPATAAHGTARSTAAMRSFARASWAARMSAAGVDDWRSSDSTRPPELTALSSSSSSEEEPAPSLITVAWSSRGARRPAASVRTAPEAANLEEEKDAIQHGMLEAERSYDQEDKAEDVGDTEDEPDYEEHLEAVYELALQSSSEEEWQPTPGAVVGSTSAPQTPVAGSSAFPSGARGPARPRARTASAELDVSSGGEASDRTPTGEPSTKQLERDYKQIRRIPTRDVHEYKIRKQRKYNRHSGAVPPARSRKRQYTRKRATIRQGLAIYHAHNAKAQYLQQIVKDETFLTRLLDLQRRRPDYAAARLSPLAHSTRAVAVLPPTEVPWPDTVTRIWRNLNPDKVEFNDLEDIGRCCCWGDCFRQECNNAEMSVYCTRRNCNLRGKCSNAIRESPSLRLFDAGVAGLGVFTMSVLEAGDIIGEYCGVLSELDGVRPDAMPAALHQNSGYTMLLNAKSKKGWFVFVEPVEYGSILRFCNHACEPNAVFVEMQNRAAPKIAVMMLKTVRANSEITIHYGDAMWFSCKCPECQSHSKAESEASAKAQKNKGKTPTKKRKP